MNSRGVYCDTNRHSGEGRNPGQFSGGDKPHAYLFGDIVFVVAGFIPACKGQKVEKTTQFRKIDGILDPRYSILDVPSSNMLVPIYRVSSIQHRVSLL